MKTIDLTNKRGSAKDLALTIKEKKMLYEVLTDEKDRIILLLGCYAGLRAGEMSQLRYDWFKWTTFKFINEELKVLSIVIPGKDRDARNRKKEFKPKKVWNTALYIFDNQIASSEIYFWYKNNKDGLMISRQAIHKRIVRHFEPLLDRNMTVHALRATFTDYITQQFRFPNGEKPDTMFVKTQLRHKDLRTTMAAYKSETIANQEAYLQGVLK